jgi:hypothetical protein
MNARKLLVLGLVLVGLVAAVLFTTRVAALRQPVNSAVSSSSNQVFYSPSVESMVIRERAAQVTNQIFYSPAIETLVNRGRTATITNQIFYSPTIESFIH